MKEKRDGPGGRKRGTVLDKEKEGRSWKKEKRDGPGRRERGTVLDEENKDRPKMKNEKIDFFVEIW